MGGGAEARGVAFEADVVCVASEVLEDSDGATEASAAALLHRATYLVHTRFLEPRIGRASIAANCLVTFGFYSIRLSDAVKDNAWLFH